MIGQDLPRLVQPGWQKGILLVRENLTPAEVDLIRNPMTKQPTREELMTQRNINAAYLAQIQVEAAIPRDPLDLLEYEMISLGRVKKTAHEAEMLTERLLVSRALRALVEQILNKYLPEQKDLIVEMGPGSRLVLAELAPAELREHWHAFEMNPDLFELAVQRAARRGLGIDLCLGNAFFAYDLPFLQGIKADAWLGLSAYDSLFNLYWGLAEVKSALRSGGRFIHIQDVHSVTDAALVLNRQFPGKSRFIVRDRIPREASGRYYLAEGRVIDESEEFHDRLVFLLRHLGFRIVSEGISNVAYLGEKLPEHEFVEAEAGRELSLITNDRGDISLGALPKKRIPRMLRQIQAAYPPEKAILETVLASVVVAEKI
jgi:hypothetical protein